MTIQNEIEILINQLKIWDKAYDEGHPMVSDKEYDDNYFKLVQLEEKSKIYLPNSPTQTINYEIVNNLTKVKHNHPMLSLAKTKEIDELRKFINNNDIIVMEKMDGLTCSLRYLNGKLISAETRGNGEIGEDILHNAKVIKNIPKFISYKEELIIDGEIICDYKSFERWKSDYSNPRNMAAGVIRLLDSKECEKRNLSFIAWDIIKGFNDKKFLSQKINQLKTYGFDCVSTIINNENNFDIKNAINQIKENASTKNYPIDGVVIKYNNIDFYSSFGKTAHHFSGGIAYKFYDEEYETILRDIEWQVGRTGILSPVAVFDDVDLDGALTSRASLHNLDVIKNYLDKPFRGQKIKVARMNMVIPKITWGEKSLEDENKDYINYPKACPVCGALTEIKISDADIRTLYCTNENCKGMFLNKLIYFCGKNGLDIKGLSEATLETLINWGWITKYKDLFTLKNYRIQWIRKPGFSVTSVDKILKAINESRNCELWRFISAIGIPLIGVNIAKEIAKKEKTWQDFIKDIEEKFDFTVWEGFGQEMKNSIYSFDYNEINNLAKDIMNFENSLISTNEQNMILSNLTFVITGNLVEFSNRDELKNKIESLGGKVAGSVSKKTSYLINNDVTSMSSKNLKAHELAIPIITETEFVSKFIKTT